MKKRNKDKKQGLDLGSIDETSETHLKIKKSKNSEPKSFYFGVELEQRGEGEKCELGFDPKESFNGEAACCFDDVVLMMLFDDDRREIGTSTSDVAVGVCADKMQITRGTSG
ncbi:hypothetical protein LOK49_LG12G03001 [Camellia lanceoleosa]|uniref:Uncharacterized protein n=1 Tax=Camellia lanceoleosa TaxID=1840588 RepID=A0ACC0FSZ4_9ERIC|nr:hypothetical protein LOK49_LG12G03001 [Camellia lanceoleosa]